MLSVNAAEHVAFTTDIWTAMYTESLLYHHYSSLHQFGNADVVPYTMYTEAPSSCTAENLADKISRTFRDWGLRGKVYGGATADNAANDIANIMG